MLEGQTRVSMSHRGLTMPRLDLTNSRWVNPSDRVSLRRLQHLGLRLQQTSLVLERETLPHLVSWGLKSCTLTISHIFSSNPGSFLLPLPRHPTDQKVG